VLLVPAVITGDPVKPGPPITFLDPIINTKPGPPPPGHGDPDPVTTLPTIPPITIPPTIPPAKYPPILDPALNKDLYQRCPTTDIPRQLIYTKSISPDGTRSIFTPVPLPTSVTECIVDYYRPKNGLKYYDALGRQLDLTTFDSCGIPSLPIIKYGSNPDLKTILYSGQEEIST